MTYTVYLAGGIAGLSGAESIDWRRQATALLSNYGIITLDPMRAKRRVFQNTERISRDFNSYAHNGIFFTSRGIMARDFNDVQRCDALLVNLLYMTKPSLGTIMELAWAYALRKPAVVVMEDAGNPHDNHPMLTDAMPFRVATLDEAVDAIAVISGRIA